MFSLIAGTLTQTPNLQHLAATCSVRERERAGCCNSFSCLLKLSRELTANNMKEWISRGPLLFAEDAHNSGSGGAGRPLVAETHVCNFKFLISRCVQWNVTFSLFFGGGGSVGTLYQVQDKQTNHLIRKCTPKAHLSPKCMYLDCGRKSEYSEGGYGENMQTAQGICTEPPCQPLLTRRNCCSKDDFMVYWNSTVAFVFYLQHLHWSLADPPFFMHCGIWVGINSMFILRVPFSWDMRKNVYPGHTSWFALLLMKHLLDPFRRCSEENKQGVTALNQACDEPSDSSFKTTTQVYLNSQ